jgi:uncharacterized protein
VPGVRDAPPYTRLMSSREFDPFRLDVAAFAKAGGELNGYWPLTRFDRLTESAVGAALGPEIGDVTWSARGERRLMRGGESQVWLHLDASTELPLECQRCLKPVNVELQIKRSFLFVHGEDAAAELDAQTEDDVLAMTRALDLSELIEDELVLALPLVPRHEVCAQPLPLRSDELETDDAPNPFASLAALKRNRPLN